MTETRPARPQQLSAACLYLGGIFSIQLIRVLVLVVGISSPDGQDDVRKQIGWFRTDGASFDDAVSIYRIVLGVLAVLAAAGVVFAIYATRGDHPSRVLLGVLAVVFLIVGLSGLTGEDFFAGVLGFVGVVFAVQLWTPAVRSWFRELAGKEPLAQATPPMAAEQPTPAGREPLPKPVSVAGWTALIGSIVVGGLSAMVLLGLVLIGNDYQKIVDQGGIGADMIRDSGMDYDTLYAASLAIFSVCLVLSAGGLIGASLVLARKRSGDVVLFVMSVVTVVVSVLFFPVGLPWTAAAIVVLVQLRKPEAKRWFVRT